MSKAKQLEDERAREDQGRSEQPDRHDGEESVLVAAHYLTIVAGGKNMTAPKKPYALVAGKFHAPQADCVNHKPLPLGSVVELTERQAHSMLDMFEPVDADDEWPLSSDEQLRRQALRDKRAKEGAA